MGEITQREISSGMHGVPGVPTKIPIIQAAKDETIQGVSAGVEGRERHVTDSLPSPITWLSWNANQR